MMELRQLRYFVAAADFRSFRRAALSVNLDQSTFGRHIRDLEYRLGIELFDRARTGAKLTSSGEEVIQKARRLVSDADALLAHGASMHAGVAGRFVVGFMTPISGGSIRDALFRFHRDHPAIDLEGREAERDELFHELERGAIDFIIVTGQVDRADCERLQLWRERILVAMSQSHPLAGKPALCWDDLHDQLVVQTKVDPGPELCDMLVARISEPGRRPQMRMQSVSHETVLNGLPAGHFVTLGYEVALRSAYQGVCVREIIEDGQPASIGYSGYWRPDNDNATLSNFIGFLREEFDFPAAV